jgi:membrane protease YdiL (CAAX protease family)
MSAQKKAPLMKWWSAARGSGDDLTYYKKSRELVSVVQVAAVVLGILITAAKAIVFFCVSSALLSIMAIPAIGKPFFLHDNGALLQLWRELIPMVGVLLVTGVFVFAVEKKSIGVTIFKNPLRSISYGIRLGCISISLSLLTLVLMGTIDFGEKNSISYIWIWFASVLLNAVTQEYLVRGYLFSLFTKNFNAVLSVILTTILYTAMQGRAFETGIIAVLNVVTMSVLASLLRIYTASLMAPILVRFLWNGIGGLVLGLVSLDSGYPSVWNSVMTRNDLLSGGSAKLDGSMIALFVNVLLIAFMSLQIKKKTHRQLP